MNSKNVSIVIPSYNEVKNVSILAKHLRIVLPLSKIIIVDDSSPEENQKLKKIVKNYKDITLISRMEKKGRGSAVIMGFKKALENKSIKFVFEMDSDLAHDAYEMERFIKKIESGNYDMVLGSRYLKGGKVLGISRKRRILSKLVNFFLRIWLNVKVSDFTGGFRLYNRKSIEFLTKIQLKSKGFITLSEILYYLDKGGFKIGEVPITINIRKYGKSTVNSNELINSLTFVLKMRIKDLNNF